MDLPVHRRRVAGPGGDLLALMLAAPERHAQSNGGGFCMPGMVMDFPQNKTPRGNNMFGGGTGFPFRSWDQFPHTPSEAGHLRGQEFHVGQSGSHPAHGQKGTTRNRRHQEGGVDAACGKIRSTNWSLPQRTSLGLNAEPLPCPPRRKRTREPDDAGRDGPVAVPAESTSRARGSMAKALEVARSPESLVAARKILTKDFWAASTVQVKQSRRAEVFKLAKIIVGDGPIFPLLQATVEGVAASLKAGGMASANLYLQELKLAHVEAGFDLEAWLSRTFVLCGKSLTRNRGPVKRAPEIPVERVLAKWQRPCKSLWVPLAGLAYAWGVAWMLREVELSKVEWKHITIIEDKKWVRLFLPHSKMDQQALGIARTLRCCGEKPCWTGCAWAIALKLRALADCHAAGDPSGPVFPNKTGSFPSKSQMVNSWVKMFGTDTRGHSARRSGAMAYTRRGMTLQDLAYLGRWKSGVVLAYAEEALESVPANQHNVNRKINPPQVCAEDAPQPPPMDLQQNKTVVKSPKAELLG